MIKNNNISLINIAYLISKLYFLCILLLLNTNNYILLHSSQLMHHENAVGKLNVFCWGDSRKKVDTNEQRIDFCRILKESIVTFQKDRALFTKFLTPGSTHKLCIPLNG